MSRKTIRAPDARFTCEGDGRCCTKWSVPVSAERVETLRREDWSDLGPGDPFELNPGPGDPYRIRLVEDRCFFLSPERRCEIQHRLGYDAKPASCKAFPLQYAEVSGTSHPRLSFYCPTVAANRGERLAQQMRWLKAVHQASEVSRRTTPLHLNAAIPLDLKTFAVLDEAMQRLLADDGLPVHQRLAACVGLLRLVEARVTSPEAVEVGLAVRQAAALETLSLVRLGREGGSASRAGPVLSLFLGPDCAPNHWARTRHFVGVRLFNLHLGKLSSRFIGTSASQHALAAVAFERSPEGDALLARYFLHKIEGRRHVAGELDLISGTNLLIVGYAVVHLLSRLHAAGSHQPRVRQEDLLAGVQAAELLVLEHTGILQNASSALLMDRILTEPTLCGSLLALLEPEAAAPLPV